MSSVGLSSGGLKVVKGDQPVGNGDRAATRTNRLSAADSRIATRTNVAAAFLVVALIVVTAVYVIARLSTFAAGGQVASQPILAERGAVLPMINTSGGVIAARQARLTFGTQGQVKEVLRSVGQSVQTGQALATLEDDHLQLQLEQARSDLRMSQLRAQQANEAATPEEIAAAKSTLAAAQARVQEISSGSLDSVRAAAEADVTSAQANLAAARARTAQLASGATPAIQAEAERSVATAQAALQRAEADLAKLKAGPSAEAVAAARLQVDGAKQSLWAKQISRDAACGRGTDNAPCKAADAEVMSAEIEVRQAETRLQQAQTGARPEELAAAGAGVESARKGLDSAKADQQRLLGGATSAELQAARGAEELAKANLASAQARLDQVRAGAKTSELEAAQALVASAAAALAKTSPQASALALAEEEVRQSEISVRRAELDLSGATLRAPFDGVVTSIGINAGERIVPGNELLAITLVAPDSMRVEATVEGSDVAKLAVGQDAVVTLESLEGGAFPGRVAKIAALGTAQRGTPTYLVSVDFDPGNARLAPGMAANVDIITERKDGVLVVPSRLIQRQGEEQFVAVLVDGERQQRKVRTGTSDGKLTEIVDGLAEGDVVLAAR